MHLSINGVLQFLGFSMYLFVILAIINGVFNIILSFLKSKTNNINIQSWLEVILAISWLVIGTLLIQVSL